MLYEHKISNTAFNIASLNPYYDGICSMSVQLSGSFNSDSLNPYYDGICSMRLYRILYRNLFNVLILIMMEYAL